MKNKASFNFGEDPDRQTGEANSHLDCHSAHSKNSWKRVLINMYDIRLSNAVDTNNCTLYIYKLISQKAYYYYFAKNHSSNSSSAILA